MDNVKANNDVYKLSLLHGFVILSIDVKQRSPTHLPLAKWPTLSKSGCFE